MPRSPRRPLPLAAAALIIFGASGGLLALPSPVTAASHEVQITDSAFVAPVLTIRVGDTVTWTNVDDRPHTATSVDGAFDSGNLDEGGTFSFTFTEPGSYEYLCEYHSDMHATIVVLPASGGSTAAEASAAAATATAQAAPTAHDAGHGTAGDPQPDTALPSPSTIPVASLLLWGLGLLGFAVVLIPSSLPARAGRGRPSGGWRR